ncbi:hypothetical protein NDU88_002825 [Pleurodeles waltl]|uniref:Uncharacterized protein n=1 Tax=Pleurodeles waltl TaxID=8319 RepID=A0AAV7TPD9_PLEWA|nr:hypothetical protein NDU88_002825 [Pleurodeles waltl]
MGRRGNPTRRTGAHEAGAGPGGRSAILGAAAAEPREHAVKHKEGAPLPRIIYASLRRLRRKQRISSRS